jgi:hypothetical protein
MDSYLPNLPEGIDGSTGIPKEVTGIRNGLSIALNDYNQAVQTIDADAELNQIADQRYVTKKKGEMRAVAAAGAEREIARLEKLVAGHESVIEKDAAALTIGRAPDPAVTSAIIQSFSALDKQARQATLLACEQDLAVPSRAQDARDYLRAILGSNIHLNLIPSLVVNGSSLRDRLEASLKTSINPDGAKRINDSRLACVWRIADFGRTGERSADLPKVERRLEFRSE